MKTVWNLDDRPLSVAKASYFKALEIGNQITCPCCDRKAQIFHRQITGMMAWVLCALTRRVNDHATVGKPCSEWIHVAQYMAGVAMTKEQRAAGNGGDWAKLKHWGLIERMPARREDGSHDAGFWKVTLKGMAFATGELSVPQFALVYENQLVKLDGDQVWVKDVVKKKFNLQEVLGKIV